MICFKVFVLILYAISVQCEENPYQLTKQEMVSLFPSDPDPEFQIVHIKHKNKKRSLNEDYEHVFLNTFNRSLSLYLEPKDSVLISKKTRIWYAFPDSKSPQGVKYVNKTAFGKPNFRLLQDVSNRAAITIEEDDDENIKMTGHIGDDLVVKPLPTRILVEHNRIRRQKRDHNHWQSTPHIVQKLPPVKKSKVLWPINGKRNYPGRYWNKYAKYDFDTVYPETLVFITRSLYRKLNRNIENVIKYVSTFWNAVDLQFRQLNNPRVRINIAAIIISTGKKEVPFIANNTCGENQLDADTLLEAVGTHLFSNKNFIFRKDYDVFMGMTSHNLCNIDKETNYKDCSTMGYAYVRAVCSILDKKQVEAVGMVEDNGGFKGIMLAAHELGHLLGVDHDEDSIAEECKDDNSYIMHNKLGFSDDSFDWSPCSLKNFTQFLRHPNSSCVINKPKLDERIQVPLPGIYYSEEYQCEQYRKGSIPCKSHTEITSICVALQCTSPLKYNDCDIVVPAAEGTPCGHESICLHGKCISKQRRKHNYNNYKT